MTLAAIMAVVGQLAALGASPAVQQAVIQILGRMHGHSQADIDAAVAAQKMAWEPIKGTG